MSNPSRDIRLFGTFFKPYPMVETAWMTPVGVDGFVPNNGITAASGVNIAGRGPFCEVRTQYWVRHNIHAQFVGFYHYRRYFNFLQLPGRESQGYFRLNASQQLFEHLASPAQLDCLTRQLSAYDVVAARPTVYGTSLAAQFQAGHGSRVWEAYLRALHHARPALAAKAGWYDVATYAHFLNMFIMPWDVFCAYMDDLMPVLETLAGDLGDYTADPYQARYIAFVAERFLPFWLTCKRLSTVGVQVFRIDVPGERTPGSGA